MTMLFIDNKYTRWYYDIIDRAKTRTATMQKNKLAKKLAQEKQNS